MMSKIPFDLPDYTVYYFIAKEGNEKPIIIKGGISVKNIDEEKLHTFMNSLSKVIAETYTQSGVVSD